MGKWQVGLLIAALAGGLTIGCGKDKDSGSRGGSTGGDNNGGRDAGNAGENTATGGRDGGGGEEQTGGRQNQGGDPATGGRNVNNGGDGNVGNQGGNPPATGGNPPATGGVSGGGDGPGGATGTGGAPPVTAGIDDLITAICEWEFGCCEPGETTYRLGTSGVSVEDCVSDFVFQLHESNQTDNPHPAGTAQGLLGVLGFTVNLDRVVENPAGIQECIEAWQAMGCSEMADPGASAHCGGSFLPGEGPCSLVNLFDPGLQRGDRCTLGLTEGADGNDVECPAGTTCVPADDPDNPENYPSCVQRGTEGRPCTNDGDCDYNFYCNAGDCTEKGDEGDSCSFDDPANPVPDDEDAKCKAGLKCNPNSLTCVVNCSIDYPCDIDFECPDGQSCRPETVSDDATSWHTCQLIGEGSADRCDDNLDCSDDRRCSGGVCARDLGIGDDCTTDEECEDGTFCDTALYDSQVVSRTATGQCTPYFNAREPCFALGASYGYSSGCNPSTAPQCVFVGTSIAVADRDWECRATVLQEGDACIPYSVVNPRLAAEASDCAEGLTCQYATDTATMWTCTVGADAGEACDDNVSDGDALTCAPGLFCDTEALPSPVCVEQLDPGADCEDPHNANTAQPGLCKNGACVEHWDGNGSYICTDAPVPTANTGDGLTCNGNGG